MTKWYTLSLVFGGAAFLLVPFCHSGAAFFLLCQLLCAALYLRLLWKEDAQEIT